MMNTHKYLILGILYSLILTTCIYLFISPQQSSKATSLSDSPASLRFPIRGIFYYPWFPETWANGATTPFTHYQPTLGFYSSSDSAVIKDHIRIMQYAGMQVGIIEWNGQHTLVDQRIPLLLKEAAGTGFHWAIYYDQEGLSVGFGPNPTPAQITGDLSYINQNYGNDPSYAKIENKPLIFVYADPQDDCGMADRWKQANKDANDYIVLKVFDGYSSCSNQPNAWHQYNPELREDSQLNQSYTVSAGFWKADEASPRLVRDSALFSKAISSMVASHAPFQLVTSFNEWGEGSAIESAKEWSSPSGYGLYVDILHNLLY